MFSVLIPYRYDSPERAKNLEYTTTKWSELGVEVFIGQDTDSGPFNLAKTINKAFTASSGDKILLFGADHIPPSAEALEAASEALEAHPWVPMFSMTHEIAEQESRFVRSGIMSPSLALRGLTINMCTGIIALTREAYKAAGGQDERFQGWGYEDTAFRACLSALYGDVLPLGDVLYGLYHPQQVRQRDTANNRNLYHEYLSVPRDCMEAYISGRGRYV